MKGKTGIIIAGAALGTLAVALFGVRGTAAEAVYPVENGRNWFARHVGTRLRGMFSRMDLAVENRRLKEENAALRMELSSVLARRASHLASETGNQPFGTNWISAPVLSRSGTAGVKGYLRVGKGSLAGVSEGAVVTVPEGLVGRVTEVTPHTAVVTLLADPSIKVACEIEVDGPSRASGILSGGGEDLLVLRHLRHAGEVPPRSRVLTSGRGGVFPPGLVVGTLLEVRKDAKGLSREGEVLPPVDYSTLEDVFIRREK